MGIQYVENVFIQTAQLIKLIYSYSVKSTAIFIKNRSFRYTKSKTHDIIDDEKSAYYDRLIIYKELF